MISRAVVVWHIYIEEILFHYTSSNHLLMLSKHTKQTIAYILYLQRTKRKNEKYDPSIPFNLTQSKIQSHLFSSSSPHIFAFLKRQLAGHGLQKGQAKGDEGLWMRSLGWIVILILCGWFGHYKVPKNVIVYQKGRVCLDEQTSLEPFYDAPFFSFFF